jgi:hypothetical protein
MAMKPRANANEDAAGKPFGAIVAVGSTAIRSGIIIAIGAIGLRTNLHGNLSRCFRSGYHQEASSNSG